MPRRSHLLFMFAALVLPLFVRAGGGPERSLIVVNDRSADSLELGAYYARRHGMDQRQICHVNTTTSPSIDWASFTNEIEAPVRAFLQAQGLSNQVDLLVLTQGMPYRVYTNSFAQQRFAGITATLFHGHKSAASSCSLAPGSSNALFAAERAFSHQAAPSSNRFYLAAYCAGFTLDDAKRTIDRGAAPGEAGPAAAVFLHTSDEARSVQWPRAEEAEFLLRFATGSVSYARRDGDFVGSETNLLGILTGTVDPIFAGWNQYVPGGFSEHLTSYAGYLYETPPDAGQRAALRWLQAGCAGSYGTVVEPCAYIEKFTQPVVHYYLARGFNIAESQFMAVQHPYQGVLVGDPLAAPFAKRPGLALAGLAPGSVVSGSVPVVVTGTAGAAASVSRIETWIDGMLTGTLTSAPPTAGNVAQLVAGAVTASCTVASGDDLFRVASGLAAALNSTGGPVRAVAAGDRIQLAYTNAAASGASIGYTVSCVTGSASRLTLAARAASPHLLDSEFHAREFVALQGTAVTGDQLICTLTLTSGVAVTTAVVAASGEASSSVLSRMMNALNADATLQTTQGVAARYLNAAFDAGYCEAVLEARRHGPEGAGLFVDWLVMPVSPGVGLSNNLTFSDRFNDNQDVMAARGEVFLSDGLISLVATQTLDTTLLADGPHTLTFTAVDGSGVRAEATTSIAFRVANIALSASITCSPTVLFSGGFVTVRVTSAGSVATQCALRVEGKDYTASSGTAAVFVVATTNRGAGLLAFQGMAQAPGGQAFTDVALVEIHSDRDGDGLSDQWEYIHFGSATNAAADDDPDGDGVSNRDEWLADTIPTNAPSRFVWTSVSAAAPDVLLAHAASSSRSYQLEVSDALLVNWSAVGAPRPGTAGYLLWTNPAATAANFRVRSTLP